MQINVVRPVRHEHEVASLHGHRNCGVVSAREIEHDKLDASQAHLL